MSKINPLQIQHIKINNRQDSDKTTFKGNTTYPVVNSLPQGYADYSVKTPVSYSKTGEINLPYNTKAHLFKLANGQQVVIIPKEGKTYLETYVNTGSMNEFDNIRGISHYIEHNLFNGSEGLEAGEFFAQTDKMGAVTNASTAFAETNYFIGSHLLNDGDLEKKIKLHSSMLQSPKFAIDMLEKEKGIVNSEINMITSYPENIAVNRTLTNLFGYKTTSPDLIAGSTTNITNLTKDDVLDYFNRNYYPANMVTVVTGEVNPDETIQLLAKYFNSNKTPSQPQYNEPITELQTTKREDLISDKAVSTIVSIGFVGPENNNSKDRILSEALITLIENSPELNKDLKLLNTDIYSMSEKVSTKPSAKRAIILNSEMSEENSEKFLKALYKEINTRSNYLPTEEEVNMVKKKMLNNFSRNFEYSYAVNDLTGKTILEGNLASLTDYENIVNNITPQDIVNTARKYLNLNKAALTVVHPENVTAQSIHNNHKQVAFTGSKNKKTAINLNEVSQYKLPNNIKVVTNNTNTRNSTFILDFKTETPVTITNPAAPFVLNRILNQGSMFRNYDNFRNDNNKNDIQLNFSFGENFVECYSTSDFSDITKALAATKEVLYNPRFTEDSLTNVKTAIRDNLERCEKSPLDNLEPELYKGHLSGISRQEILDNLDKVTLDDIKNLYSQVMSNAKSSFVISAPLRQNPHIMNEILHQLSLCPKVTDFNSKLFDDFTPQQTTKVLTDTHNHNQADIMMAYKFKINGNLKDTAVLEILNIILGGGSSSRLFNDLREKQKLAYDVHSSLTNSHNSKTILLSIGTTTENKDTGEVSYDNVQKSIEGFKYHIKKLMQENVTEEELTAAKLSLKDSILSQNQSGEGKCDNLAYSMDTPYGLTRENQLLDIIDTITTEDIRNAANYIFSNKPVYSIVATENTLKNNSGYLKSLEV